MDRENRDFSEVCKLNTIGLVCFFKPNKKKRPNAFIKVTLHSNKSKPNKIVVPIK